MNPTGTDASRNAAHRGGRQPETPRATGIEIAIAPTEPAQQP